MSEQSGLYRRVVAAAVFGPILVALFWFGGIPLIAGLCLLLAGGTWEFYRMEARRGLQPWTPFGIAASLVWCLLVFRYRMDALSMLFAALLVITSIPFLSERLERLSIRHAVSTLRGYLYVGFLGSFSLMVRNFPGPGDADPKAAPVAIIILVGIWSTDIGAYFSGRMFGRHRPFPRISPGKTDAGFIGGLFFGVAAVMAGSLIFNVVTFWIGVGLAVLVGFGSLVGDLLESMIKRRAGIKDSSNLIPGHGGILDRFDGFLFVFPLVYLYLSLLPQTPP